MTSRAVIIYAVTFVVLMVVNQMFYGACFRGHCLAAAFPKVVILSAIVTAVIVWSSKQMEDKSTNS